jgi:hypothetical protein
MMTTMWAAPASAQRQVDENDGPTVGERTAADAGGRATEFPTDADASVGDAEPTEDEIGADETGASPAPAPYAHDRRSTRRRDVLTVLIPAIGGGILGAVIGGRRGAVVGAASGGTIGGIVVYRRHRRRAQGFPSLPRPYPFQTPSRQY